MPFRFIHSRRTLVGTTFGRTMHTQIPSSHRAADWCESNGVCCVRSAASEWQSSCCTLRAHASGCVMSYVVLVMRMEFFRLAASCCGTRHRPMSSCNPSSRQSPKRLVQTRSGSLSCNRPRLPHLQEWCMGPGPGPVPGGATSESLAAALAAVTVPMALAACRWPAGDSSAVNSTVQLTERQ